jgi:hypothetical protein
VDIVPDVPFNQGDKLSLSLQQDGALPAQKDVDNPGPAEQPPAKTNTSLSATCPDGTRNDAVPQTTTGRRSPGFAGADIAVTYTRPDNTTFTRTAQTDSNGAWSSTINPIPDGNQQPDGTWKVKARYAGDTSHNPSEAEECAMNVQTN